MYEIYNDDCLNKLKDIKDKSIDLVLIDPPYNIGKDKKWDKWKTVNAYVEFMGEVFKECQRVLKDFSALPKTVPRPALLFGRLPGRGQNRPPADKQKRPLPAGRGRFIMLYYNIRYRGIRPCSGPPPGARRSTAGAAWAFQSYR